MFSRSCASAVSTSLPVSSAIFATTSGILSGVFTVPRKGTGAIYGLSVSDRIRSKGTAFNTSALLAFFLFLAPPKAK